MEEITKKELVQEVLEKTRAEEDNIIKKSKYLIENLAVIFSVTTVFIILALYSYNRGYYKTYSIAESCITVDLKDFLPAALQLCGVYLYIVFYLVQLKKEQILKQCRFNLLRILYGEFIIHYILQNAHIDQLIGAVPVFIISIVFPLLIEILWWVSKKDKKDRVYNGKEKQIVLEGMIEDRLLYLLHNKYALGIMVTIVLWASFWGNICAKSKNEYQIFEKDGVSYAVIIDREEYAIVEKVNEEKNSLFIDASSYMYVNKENYIFCVTKYTNVEIEK